MGELGENPDFLLESSRYRYSTVGATVGLLFKDVSVDLADKRILWSVSGHATPGRLLAVMGPSGSGKTTLLDTLAGYTNFSSGDVSLNGSKLSKKLKRKISYVLQADIFFPNLTLRETLRYSALLRLPREYTFREKLSKVEDIIATLGLSDCANTVIGNIAVRGLSGGEKKRVNIGCEMLTNPAMLLLDEPTSGLDSSSAFSLMQTLCKLAKEQQKIVVASIHQPSSQLYHMFDDLMLLAKGKVAYFGEASRALECFSSRGLQCTLHYNPADFMLEMVTQDESRKLLIGEDPIQKTPIIRKVWWKRVFWWKDQSSSEIVELQKNTDIEEYKSSPQFPPRRLSVNSNTTTGLSRKESSSALIAAPPTAHSKDSRKWPTPWHWQILVLIVRTFRQSRHIILSKLNLLQTILLSGVVSLVWFQIPDDVESIADRLGYLFFTVIFWSFQPLFVATMSLPAEHAVISKERRSGSYHLSAYYLAKGLSELPLALVLPSIFLVITYWCTGLNGWASFFGILLILLLTSVVAQGLGLLIGAVFMNFQRSIVAAAVLMLTHMLLGGFYVRRLPYWLNWAQYVSFISYAYDALLEVGFSGLNLRCGEGGTAELFPSCGNNPANETELFANATVSSSEVLRNSQVNIPILWYWNLLILVGFGLVFRIGAYFALRFLHRK